MWKAFFVELGFDVVTSSDTNKDIIYNGVEVITAETCFPIKVAHGHVIDMLDRNIDYLFLPSIVNLTHASPRLTHSYACPYVQCIPYLVNSAIDFKEKKFTVLSPVIHFEYGEAFVNKTLRQIAKSMGITGEIVDAAIRAAREALKTFNKTLEARGREILDKLGEKTKRHSS